MNDGYTDTDVIQNLNRYDTIDLSDYIETGAIVSVERITQRFLQIDLNGEDQINIFGNRQALNAAELQLGTL